MKFLKKWDTKMMTSFNHIASSKFLQYSILLEQKSRFTQTYVFKLLFLNIELHILKYPHKPSLRIAFLLHLMFKVLKLSRPWRNFPVSGGISFVFLTNGHLLYIFIFLCFFIMHSYLFWCNNPSLPMCMNHKANSFLKLKLRNVFRIICTSLFAVYIDMF